MGFSADWLGLREPADHAARDAGLLRRAASAAGAAPVVLDLGCGSGSTVRALAPHLPADTSWRLVDNDPALLERAAQAAGDGGRTICLDLTDLDALPVDGVTLVTASALFDLVSQDWLAALATRLKVPLYAALSYDGAMTWDPADPLDDAVTAAFNAHQRSDKGFGPALGPDAPRAGATTFEAAGFSVLQAESPWTLGPDQVALQQALVTGIAAAAAETGLDGAAAWGTRRLEAASFTVCRIGHGDLLALPPTTVAPDAHA